MARTLLFALALVALPLAGCASNDPADDAGKNGADGNGAPAVVDMTNSAFSPAALTIAKGGSVTFKNNDEVPHTATSEEGDFDTGQLDQGDSATITLDEAGTFSFTCLYHPDMMGTLTVTA